MRFDAIDVLLVGNIGGEREELQFVQYETIDGRCRLGECHRHLFHQKTENGTIVPHKVTDGLQILGVPVGSASFCNTFIDKAIAHAQADTVKLVQDLNHPLP
jgi:hypothetical protein